MQSDSLLQKLCIPCSFIALTKCSMDGVSGVFSTMRSIFPIVSKAIEKSGHRQNVIDFCLEL